jgi:3-hydroxyisobutyrate dehydrogenase-like beta-hydroxyacid dehydrogenase
MFGVLGRATVWLGPAGNGTKAKLVLNNWLADLTEMTAETLSFALRASRLCLRAARPWLTVEQSPT